MSDRVLRFPKRFKNTKRLDARKGKLRCEVSDRWLQFPKKADSQNGIEYMFVNVMTLGAEDNEKKLCEIVLDRKELLKILNELPVNEQE